MTENGMCSAAPMAPLSTMGIATQKVPTTITGIASRQVSPTAMIELAYVELEGFSRKRSVNAYGLPGSQVDCISGPIGHPSP